jgi:hypothetical protein
MEAMVSLLPICMVYQCEPFSTLFERKRKKMNVFCGIYLQMPKFPQNPY